VSGCHRGHQIAAQGGIRAGRQDEPAIGRARKRLDRALEFAGIAHVQRRCLDPERGHRRLDRSPLTDPSGDGRIAKDGGARDVRRRLFEQLQPLRADAVFELDESGDIAAGPRQALHYTSANWIGHVGEHDRHALGRLQQRSHRGSPAGDDHVRHERK
jgi:hypothetical protein